MVQPKLSEVATAPTVEGEVRIILNLQDGADVLGTNPPLRPVFGKERLLGIGLTAKNLVSLKNGLVE